MNQFVQSVPTCYHRSELGDAGGPSYNNTLVSVFFRTSARSYEVSLDTLNSFFHQSFCKVLCGKQYKIMWSTMAEEVKVVNDSMMCFSQ